MDIDTDNPIIKLCIAGTQAEFEGKMDDARALFNQAWEAASDHYEACIAAHYVARFQTDPAEGLRWNLGALRHARLVGDDRVKGFYPSLYLSIGRAYEVLGDWVVARSYYDLAAALGVVHREE
jgi:hypothetical protein